MRFTSHCSRYCSIYCCYIQLASNKHDIFNRAQFIGAILLSFSILLSIFLKMYSSALAVRPKVAYVSDIHEPTLLNAAHNVKLNAQSAMEVNECANTYQSSVINFPATATSPASTTAVKVINMSWTDPATYPPEQASLLLGSDLVYDIGILAVLIPAICASLATGKYDTHNYSEHCVVSHVLLNLLVAVLPKY